MSGSNPFIILALHAQHGVILEVIELKGKEVNSSNKGWVEPHLQVKCRV
jgi:hypothetical protein